MVNLILRFFILTLGIILSIVKTPAQSKISGRVTNDQNLALPYVSIGVKDSKIASVTKKDGTYQLDFPENVTAQDSIIFSTNGYAEERLSYQQLLANPNIVLAKKETAIEGIVIKSEKLKDKIIGEKSRPFLTFTKFFDQNVPTIEQGNLFSIENTTKLRAYNFFIMPSSRFQELTLKLNIYNTKNGLPYQSLLSENITFTTTTTGWQRIDLAQYHLIFRKMKDLAVTLQLVDYKKLPDADFVFGLSAKKTLSQNLLYRYQSQGNWEPFSGQFIANLEVAVNKNAKDNAVEPEDNISTLEDEKLKEQLLISKYKDEAQKSDYGKNKSGKFLDINDAKIYYEIYGKGEPLVLLHGNGGSISDFYKQIPFLAKQFQVIAIDTRGQGRSTNLSDKDYTYQQFSEDLNQLMDYLNIDKFSLVGWSDGGNTGLIFTKTYPNRVKKLVTIGANLFPEGVEDSLLTDFKNQYSNPENTGDKRLLKLMLTQPQLTALDLKSIASPVLIIAGEKDVIKEDHSKLIKNSIEDSELLIIPNAGHYVPFEQPKILNEHILKFLRK